MISMTDNKATRTTFVRTRPTLHEAEAKAEAGCYEVENFGLEATFFIKPPHLIMGIMDVKSS